MGVLSNGKFVVLEFCPVENLSCVSFVQWRICRVGVLSNGEFAVGGCPVENLSCGSFVQ